ncbi:hypothetical protein [Streptomyces brasiliensis]|uniref:Uncharacterized protein n=1 Tax=Streptomyces brasiliensis TaxID=1954 RepID=A0A917NR89_9ACTN|nr:hypothetical protein [Streptomyces brasiliensis]GGJ20851.1 hypothetical protein GCM10010121_034770 [Streptomyces brasiliensis]
MGERQSDGGLPDRRHVHPGATPTGRRRAGEGSASGVRPTGEGSESGSWSTDEGGASGPRVTGEGRASGSRSTGGAPAFGVRSVVSDDELESAFAVAIRRGGVGVDGEQQAVAAFRAARDAGTHKARTRRRDDWRPRASWRAKFSVRTALSVLLASLTLGGVAVAAIGGSSSDGAHDGEPGTHPATSAPPRSSAGSDTGSSAHRDRPDTAKDILAHCRAYEQVADRGKALDSTAWQRLIKDAGGEKNVVAYCAEQLAGSRDRADGNGQDSSQNNGQSSSQNSGRGSGQNPGKGTRPSNSGKANGNAGTSVPKSNGNQ